MSNAELDTGNETRVKAYVSYTLPEDYKEPREHFRLVDREKYKFDHHFQALKFDIVKKLNFELVTIKEQSQQGRQVTIADLKQQRSLIEKQVNFVISHSIEGMESIETLFFFLLDRSNYFIKKYNDSIKALEQDSQRNKAEREAEDHRVRQKIDDLTEKVKSLLAVQTVITVDPSQINDIHYQGRTSREADTHFGGATKTFKMKKLRN